MLLAFILAAAVSGDVCGEEILIDLADVERLPTAKQAEAELAKAACFEKWLDLKAAAAEPGHPLIAQTRRELEACQYIWGKIYFARSAYVPSEIRADYLAEIRTVIGDEAYYGGNWPPAFPYWRIPRE